MTKYKVELNSLSFFYFILWAVYLGSTLIYFNSDEPYIIENNDLLNIPNLSFAESRDRNILTFWIVFTILILTIILFTSKIYGLSKVLNRLDNNIFLIITLSFILLAFNWSLAPNYVLENYPNVWTGIPINLFFIGFLFSVLIIYTSLYSNKFFYLLKNFLLALIVLLFVPTLIQIPANIDDESHFNFLVDEFLYSYTDRILFKDFFPVYTNLFAFLAEPILAKVQISPIHVVLFLLILMQVACIFLISRILRSFQSSSSFWISFIVFLAPIFYINNVGLSVKSAFSIFPVRVFLPTILFFVLYNLVFAKNQHLKAKYFLTGILAGVTLVNNFEFGAPAIISTIYTLLIFQNKKIFKFISNFFLFLLGLFFAIFTFFLILISSNDSIIISDVFAFHLATLSGYFALPMAIFGIHSVIVPFLIFNFLISSYFLISKKSNSIQFQKKSLTLIYFSLWALLTIPYFTGRSLSEHLFAGLGYQLAVISATLFSLMITQIKKMKTFLEVKDVVSIKLMTYISLLLTINLTFVFQAEPPTYHLSKLKFMSQHTDTYKLIKKDLNYILDNNSIFQSNSSKIAQILPLAQVIEINLSIPSALITNHPTHVERIKFYSNKQCNFFQNIGYSHILMHVSTFQILRSQQSCQSVLNQESVEVFTTEESQYALVEIK